MGRIHRETVLHNVITKPLGYLNFLTFATEFFKKVVSALGAGKQWEGMLTMTKITLVSER